MSHLTGRGEQVEIIPDDEVVEIRLERLGGYQSPVHVHGEEFDVVVLSVKWILVVRIVVGVVIDAAPHQTFRQGAEEQVLERARPGTRGNGVDLAVYGPHRMFDSVLLEGLYVRHLHGRIQGGLLCEQGIIDDVLASHQSYLDIDAIDQEFILHEHFHVETAHHVDDTTPHDVRSSSKEHCISRGSVGDLNGIHARGRVLVPQLTRQLRGIVLVQGVISVPFR